MIGDQIADQIAQVTRSVDAFERSVAAPDEGAFLTPLRRWTPRDIVAHLVGWNRLVIEGSRQILKGELPFYDVDPGEDFANVNADLIRNYPSKDRDELLEELRGSEREPPRFCARSTKAPGTVISACGTKARPFPSAVPSTTSSPTTRTIESSSLPSRTSLQATPTFGSACGRYDLFDG